MNQRAKREILHGELLASAGPEPIWGWESPAGRVRAARRAELIIRGAMLGPNVRALEIGCGTGVFTEIFSRTGAQIIAVDISPDLIERAMARNLPKDTVSFLECRFEECAMDRPLDAIIGSSILHHLEIEEALHKIHELLRPGGILSFAEPNLMNPQVLAERKVRRLFPYVSPDETAFLRWQFKDLLEKTGFTDVEITPFDWLHPYVPRPLIGTVSALGRTLEKIPLVREFSGSLYIKAIRP